MKCGCYHELELADSGGDRAEGTRGGQCTCQVPGPRITQEALEMNNFADDYRCQCIQQLASSS